MDVTLPAACTGAGMADRLTAFVIVAGCDPMQIRDIYSFGDTPEVVDRLAELVVSGSKRATTSLRRWYGSGMDRMPAVADTFVVVGDGCVPRAIARVTRVDVKPFSSVDANDAWDEGEGDRSLAYWRAAHRAYFVAEAVRSGFVFDERDDVVFCRFEVLYPYVVPEPVVRPG